jgi:acetylornithine deacetylase/succinyl-diaminopimelate desuccinylase family protein
MHTADLLRDLVRLPSVNPMGRAADGPIFLEHRVTDYLDAFFNHLGVKFERQPVAPQRANIVARFDSGSSRTIVFEVHQDTVPVDGMVIDPFGGEIRDGKLYGRGACDVKGGMVAMLTAFARLVRERPKGAANVILGCTVDEEHTFFGVQRFVQGLKADFAIVAEPTRLKIVHTHKGVIRWSIQTSGRSCHSSRPDRGVNAIYRMGKILNAFQRYADQLQQSRIDPLLGPPTISIGRIEGGLSVNTVPDFCRVEVDRRLLPGEDGATTVRDCWDFLLRQTDVDVPFAFSEPWTCCPALPPCSSPELLQRLGDAIDTVAGPHEREAVPYGTDASTLALAGIPAVVFGPGDITQAHTADEWIELSQIDQAAEILFRFAKSFAG